MDDLKQIRTLSLKSLIIASLSLEYKYVLKSPSWHIHQVFNCSKQFKNQEDMGLELERSLELFSKNFKAN
jgi:hypothetical protein